MDSASLEMSIIGIVCAVIGFAIPFYLWHIKDVYEAVLIGIGFSALFLAVVIFMGMLIAGEH